MRKRKQDADGQQAVQNGDNRIGDLPESGIKSGRKKKRSRKKEQTDQLIRIEELEALMAKYGGDIDPETIVSMYRPHRKRRQIGAALLRLDRLHLILLAMMLTVAILFITAFMQEKMGNLL